MLRGDISNKRSYLFGFRCENSLFRFKDKTPFDKLLNWFSGRFHRADVDEEVFSLMNYIYWNTEYTTALVIDDEHYTDKVKDFLFDFPFNQVFNIRSISEVTMMLNTGEMTYYVDNCESSRYSIQSRYAVTAQELNTILHRHYGRLT